MKLHFESDLDYQWQAVEAVCDLFKGQESGRSVFTVAKTEMFSAGGVEGDLGIGNRTRLLNEEWLENLRAVQLRNGLAQTAEFQSRDFTVEMETGTGKTYVYLRTLLELNKRYGFTKFVIVVPSVAIKEGVYKTLQITEEHFKALYAGVTFEYYLYDSSNLGQVRNFATSNQIQIMLMTVGAINKKDVNNLYKANEKTEGRQPIDFIKDTQPIVIVDEPQSVDGGLEGKGKEALARMAPLCTLRYSATHINKYNMLYRLDAVDAYERKLVKQIEVAAATIENAYNKPYLRFLGVKRKKNILLAEVELDTQTKTGVDRKRISIQTGDNLEMTTGREIYTNFRIGEIRADKGAELLELSVPGDTLWLKVGEAHADVAQEPVERLLIRRTIKEHLDKELRLKAQGIKVLSLFFIDSVEKYRKYVDGKPQKGEYATAFEEEYKSMAKHPDYRTLFADVDLTSTPEEVHDGYFSIDKSKEGKGKWIDTAETNEKGRESAEHAYNLIMKDKEKLLSFDTKLKFIFSHSALKEGWDNPNVFQICVLRKMTQERERRQTIGRGLRLCVNQTGERQRTEGVNTLTVIATENYETFAENLQKEIEADTGIRFGFVEKHHFAHCTNGAKNATPLGAEKSAEVWEWLRRTDCVSAQGKVQDALKQKLKEGSFLTELPGNEELAEILRGQCAEEDIPITMMQLRNVLLKMAGKLDIKNADDRKRVPLKKEVLLGEDFQALWERIKHKTTYRVLFDNEALIRNCAEKIRKDLVVPPIKLHWTIADITIGPNAVSAKEKSTSTAALDESGYIQLPDLLTELQDKTQLTRRSLWRMLDESRMLPDFTKNPQQFIAGAAELINRAKQAALVDGIKYNKLGDSEFYAQELFEKEELTEYLTNSLEVRKCVFEKVVYDSAVEKDFAEQMEKDEAVKVYAKLPRWFQVPTPLGPYNPDWAVLIQKDNTERLYFVVETKGSLFTDDLRDKESGKIECGKAHFKALAGGRDGGDACFLVAKELKDVLNTTLSK
jgi:type III restriction enzyme